jgi:Ni/Co efflux regulator RcnB
MKKTLVAALAAATAISGVTAGAAAAQPGYYGSDRYYGGERYRDSDRDGRPDYREWNRDRDRDGRPDQYDRRDRRSDRYDRSYRYYGGNYGYDGYRGRWRTGQRYPYYRNDRYIISDYRAYRLPPPRPGYRYYRDNNGDVVMAAIASGVIGLIIGGALADNNDRDHHRGYYYR